ncbi:hypothetical protein ACIPL1_07870 [Pseudomonas sp. NPDC090202]|uniref:hypothetical protein n=1 Tax=unclassified Pseudomonas TaxID=196821 RepID=UPI003801D5A2
MIPLKRTPRITTGEIIMLRMTALAPAPESIAESASLLATDALEHAAAINSF